MIALLLATAHAAGLGLGARVCTQLDDPFLRQSGLGLSADLAPLPGPAPWAAIGIEGLWFPVATADDTALGRAMDEALGVTADLSPLRARGALTLQLSTPWAGPGGWETRVGLRGGLALSRTEDDLEAIGVDPDEAPDTVAQWHPGPTLGLQADLRRGGGGARIALERIRYTEQILDLDEARDGWWIGVEGRLWR